MGFLIPKPAKEFSPDCDEGIIIPKASMTIDVSPIGEGISTRVHMNKSPILTRTASVEVLQQGKVNFNRDNCCWVCEGWLEKRFKLDMFEIMPDMELTHIDYNVFIHFDFDDWEPDITQDKRKNKGAYRGKHEDYRMIPQGASLYFYSYLGMPFINPKEPTIEIDEILQQHISRKVLPQPRSLSSMMPS